MSIVQSVMAIPDNGTRLPMRVVETEFGKLIYADAGYLSIDDLRAIQKDNPSDTSVVVMGVANTFNAFMAICERGRAKEWTDYAAQYAKDASNGDPEKEWLIGPYTGMSSETIFSVLAAQGLLLLSDPARVRRFNIRTPSDPEDFSRCHDLLQKMPGWAERIGEVGEAYEVWKPFSDNWTYLTELYLEETAAGPQCPRLYDRLRVLNAQSVRIQRGETRKPLEI